MRQSTLAIVVLLFSVTAAAAQTQPQRDVRQAATGTGTISGTVITDEPQPRPLRRARVSARAPELGPNGLTAVTDDRGVFSLTSLPRHVTHWSSKEG
jgi:hypothetical protein